MYGDGTGKVMWSCSISFSTYMYCLWCIWCKVYAYAQLEMLGIRGKLENVLSHFP